MGLLFGRREDNSVIESLIQDSRHSIKAGINFSRHRKILGSN